MVLRHVLACDGAISANATAECQPFMTFGRHISTAFLLVSLPAHDLILCNPARPSLFLDLLPPFVGKTVELRILLVTAVGGPGNFGK